MKANTKKKTLSTFDEMLMWTSYRYCIGRHTYVTSMAYDLTNRYYPLMDDDRKVFTANDIRSEIGNHLNFGPFSIHIHRMTSEDKYDPIDAIFTFIKKEGIESFDEFVKYTNIEYNSHTGEFIYDKIENPTISSYSYGGINDLTDLMPWQNMAACFDVDNHKMLTLKDGSTVEAFRTWIRAAEPIDENSKFVRLKDFGWDMTWISVESFVAGDTYTCICDDAIVAVNSL